jgi:hypothetical protein
MQVHSFLEESIKPSPLFKAVVPHGARADETVFVTNISFARAVNTDWTGLGASELYVNINHSSANLWS